jgi:hypothetical protein
MCTALMTVLCVAGDFVGKLCYYRVNGLQEASNALLSCLQNKRAAKLIGIMEFTYIKTCRVKC